MQVTGGDGGCDASSPEVDGCAWCVGVGVVAVAEFTRAVISPTFSAAVRQQSASVISHTADLNRVDWVSRSNGRAENSLCS